jgi:hypothetical protein
MPIYQTLVELISEHSLTDKCISLDIDNTLLYSNDDTQIIEDGGQTWIAKLNVYHNTKLIGIRNRVYQVKMVDVVTPQGAGEATYMSGILRPDAREFMAFCFSYFRIVNFWSAGKRKYVHEMVKILCADLPHQPNLIFSWDQCKLVNGDVEKPLELMFKIPGLENLMSLNNTYALDDRKSTADPNPDNLIQIPEFIPDFTIAGLTKNDNALRQLMHWLTIPEVMHCKDIRTLEKQYEINNTIKSNIFTKPITETVEPVFIRVIENVDLDTIPLLDLKNTPIAELLNDKNYNIKRSTQKNGYLGYKFLNS